MNTENRAAHDASYDDRSFRAQSSESPRSVIHQKPSIFNAALEFNQKLAISIAEKIKSLLSKLKTGADDVISGYFSADGNSIDQAPMRAELFSADQMEQHGKALAAEHSLSRFGRRNYLLNRLDENEQLLLKNCSLLSIAVEEKSRIVPAGEWLLDNLYLIKEQISTARKHLPKGYSRELPRLAGGPARGLPRVYDLALEIIAHGDGRIDAEILSRFISAYQTIAPLTLGELWAIPIMLRLALIDNLRRVSVNITWARLHATKAQGWADAMIETTESDPKNLILVIADMARSKPLLVSPFVAELARRLQGHGPSLALPLSWIEERLAESSMTIQQMVLAETQQQAADQVSISNSIGSLRFLGATDWRVFVETMSAVEKVLLTDLGDVYRNMDFATRDSYRHVIDRLAKKIRLSEEDVARAAILLAGMNSTGQLQSHVNAGQQNDDNQNSNPSDASEPAYLNHVGYYLIDKGLPRLEKIVKARISPVERINRWVRRFPVALHMAPIFFLTVFFASVISYQAQLSGLAGWRLLLVGAIALLAASHLASTLVNWLALFWFKPERLPRMDFSEGLPIDMRSMVVVPCMLSNSEGIDELLESLEVRFLGNQDEHLHFALLTDFSDAQQKVLESDKALLAQAQEGIEALNKKYPSAGNNRFFLFHRPRRWNPAEGVWMGYERKRGKLADLNALLRTGKQDRFALVVGNIYALTSAKCLSKVKYIITLDSDTQLPRDTARELIGTMAHPLNAPRYDAAGGRVVGGYGILQPRMAASLSAANRSRYVQLFGSDPGVDPYTRLVSDVYQDIYAEGSFIGKGIYDIDAFESTLGNRLPANRILSHDLLEGCYARSGLLSDVHLLEDYPATYAEDVSRRERWIRGDWQIASWLLPRVPGGEGRYIANPLSLLSRWKILDNLVRSLVPMALLLVLLIGWWIAATPWVWTLAVVGIVLIPTLLMTLVDIFFKPEEVAFSQHVKDVFNSTKRSFAQVLFRMASLPHEAIYSVAAILRSCGRLVFTHKRLLQWTPSSEQKWQAASAVVPSVERGIWWSPLLAIVGAPALLLNPNAFYAAAPIIFLWLIAPQITAWISRPLIRKKAQLSKEQIIFLRKVSRKTWAFFERFVTAEDNWLPPDNMQEVPSQIIAHRTSPTNIGMALLANVSAYDFGFIAAGVLLERTGNTLRTMKAMESYQGHLLNWYDTLTLQPLHPRYISSVDSGNLAGHLLTLRAGLSTLPDERILDVRLFAGLEDTLAILADFTSDRLHIPIADLQQQLQQARATAARSLTSFAQYFSSLGVSAAELAASFDPETQKDVAFWAQAFVKQVRDSHSELMYLAPWLAMPLAPAALSQFTLLETIPSLRELAQSKAKLMADIEQQQGLILAGESASPETLQWLADLRQFVFLGCERAAARIANIETLVRQAGELADMEYDFLYDSSRHLFAIGYNLDEYRRDTSYYDLLASEARLCSFVAIAQGKVPQDNWFALGRARTTAGGDPVLMSWSGSMFEYLMPNLVMPNYEGSLLGQTCLAAVERQIAYAGQRALPWGISESGYNTVDANFNYQYHAFGVPGLGLKRGLAEDSVITPYASALALMIAPEEACENLQRLSREGVEGRYGFYEAVDYTPARLSHGQSSAIVRSFMAHHQGMSFLSLAYLLLNAPMQRRFELDPLCQATLLLLQERIPKSTAMHTHVAEHAEGLAFFDDDAVRVHSPIEADTPLPEVQLLSNGRYHVMISNAGGGYSNWKNLAVTRWREDTTRDNSGSFIYLRDLETGEFWSTTHQPTLKRADAYEAIFNEWRAEYRRRDHDIETYSEVVVSPEDDIEIRRVKVTNRSRRTRTIELTSYAEIVLATQAADLMQTAFGNLFVQTEIIADRHAILCTRRPRSVEEHTPWLFHLLAVNGIDASAVSYETDRMKFLGRGRSTHAPMALTGNEMLSASQGSVLDPIVAIRYSITLEAEQTVSLDFVSGTADSRAATMTMVEKYQDRHFADRVFDLAYTHSGVTLRQINATETDALLYRRLGRSVIYPNATLRADANLLIQNRRGQSGLWGYAISGDLPIVLLKIASSDNIALARQMIQCHAYWRLKGLAVDLVIWNEDHVGYRQRLQDQIMGLIVTGSEAHGLDRPGGIFVRSAEQISFEDRILLQTVARAIIVDSRGTLLEQLNRRVLTDKKVARLIPARQSHSLFKRSEVTAPQKLPSDLLFANPLGGFSSDGREYIINTSSDKMTPLPWVNVLANPNFGSVISESGLSYTWSENAHEYRLTPWSDDPVGASGGEAIYLRDDDSGHFWSPTPLPAFHGSSKTSPPANYTTRHGFGYSVFEHNQGGIYSELWVYVDAEETVKFSVLKIRNLSGRARRLSATGYVEWVLGDLRSKSAMHIVTEIDASSGALFARNAYNTEFAGRVAFFDVDDNLRSLSGDRSEFFGRNGSLANPDALSRTRLSGKLGSALDPCGAIQVPFELGDGQEREIIFRLGAGRDLEQARALAQRLRKPGTARVALKKVQDFWLHTLSAVQVETPDKAVNLLANGWLLYQTMACRIWARSGFYQSGGAFGFRDQLQDSTALIHSKPELLREHLLRCAQRQYPQGDVQHWWHPPQGRGVRTRCSDDYLWLPLVTARYVTATNDLELLDEMLPFLEGRELAATEESYYDLPGHSMETASLYQHCVRAIEHGLRFGEHGLPLMGSGDWNDGMNLVGIEGKGESVWLGFFLFDVLISFSKIADARNDNIFAQRCRSEAEQLRQNLEQHAWDGQWYKRAYFDDGSALGTASNDECSIDSIAQSWSVLSGAASPERRMQAMNSLSEHLVRRDSRIIQLLDPPFDKSAMNPGYIKGYVPGVRENGGQYTHAAVWATMAFAALGDNERAWELMGIINPMNHTRTAQDIAIYKAEPYVVAADVYAIAPHTGRGGWTWYTGSAGLFYRLIIESLLGIKREGERLRILPCLPNEWKNYKMSYRYGETLFAIEITQEGTQSYIVVDDVRQPDNSIPLVDDRLAHNVKVFIKI